MPYLGGSQEAVLHRDVIIKGKALSPPTDIYSEP